MVHNLILLALLSSSVGAEDFPTLSFGNECTHGEEREKPLGSLSVPPAQMLGAEIHAFQVPQHPLALVIRYFCPKRSLFSGNYSFPIEQFDVAVTPDRDTLGRLVPISGSPVLESSSSLVATDTQSLTGGADRIKYSAAWRTSRAFVTISIMPDQPSEVPGRRVFAVTGPPAK